MNNIYHILAVQLTTMARTLTMAAIAAKELKQQLQTRFPGIQFRVGSKNYAGGSSLDVRWDFGPSVKEVEELAIQRQHGYFDGMSDGYRVTGAGMEIGPDGQMREMASVKYVFCTRNCSYTDDAYVIRPDVLDIYGQIAKGWGWHPNSNGTDYSPSGAWDGADLSSSNKFRRTVAEMSFVSDNVELMEWKYVGYEYNGRMYQEPYTIIYKDLDTGLVHDGKK